MGVCGVRIRGSDSALPADELWLEQMKREEDIRND